MWKLWKEQQTFPGRMDTKTEGAHISPYVQRPSERNASREFTVNIHSISDEEGGSVRKVRSCGKEHNGFGVKRQGTERNAFEFRGKELPV